MSILVPWADQTNPDSDSLLKGLTALIELAETAPKMFKQCFANIVMFVPPLIMRTDLDDQTRQNAMELMATFAEYAPVMCKKDPNFTKDMVGQCLAMMCEVGIDDDDASDWTASEDVSSETAYVRTRLNLLQADIEESDLNHVAAEQCMDRLANKLGGEAMIPAAFRWIEQMLASTDWRQRHAALMAISAISEGCRDGMLAQLGEVVRRIIPMLSDPHPRVRFAACNALGQMSTDFAGDMQTKHHKEVIDGLISVLVLTPEEQQSFTSPNRRAGDQPIFHHPRVRSHAAAALVNFCEEAEKEVLTPYLDALISNLLPLIDSNRRFVQEQALSTIATIADSAESAFGKWYDQLMSPLLQLLQGEIDNEQRLLRAKAMECATLIALAVGKERMGAQAQQLVQVLGGIQQNIKDPDDPQSQYLLHCWGRMCRVLGTDFLQYLPAVMPPLMLLASAKADIQLLDDEEQAEAINEDDGWELVPLKGKVIGIKTSALEDKNTAIELITVYAQILEEHFAPYVPTITESIALPGLAFFFHDPVRVASAKLVPQLLNSFKKAYGVTSAEFKELWLACVQKEIEILTAEPSIDTLAEMFQCFYESVEVVGKGCLSEQHMEDFIKSVESTLTDYEKRATERQQERDETGNADEDDDSMSLQYAIEDDQALLSDMNKAFHTVFKNMSTAFLPAWQKLMPFYQRFISHENKDATQRQWAICIYDDVLEFCGTDSYHFYQQIAGPLQAGLADPNAANRQAAAYGVGIAAQKGGAQWADFAAQSIDALFAVTARTDARSEDAVFATENACASIAKVLHYNSGRVQDAQDQVAKWIDTLPIVNDEEAAPYAYSFLAQLIEQNNPAIAPKAQYVFQNILLALEAETLQGNTAQTVVKAAKMLLSSHGVNGQQAVNQLSPEGQAAIQPYFS